MPRVLALLLSVIALLTLSTLSWSGNHWGSVMPTGEGKEMTMKLCGSCHDLQKTVVSKKTPQEWERTVYDMIGRGAQIFPDETEQIIKYLSVHFKP